MASKIMTVSNYLIFLSLVMVVSCNNDNTSGTDTPVDKTRIALSITFGENSEFALIAKYAEAIVSADDFDTIRSTLVIGTTTVSGSIQEVPAGKGRSIRVNVYDENKKLCYVGKSVVDVIADEEVIASINLYKVDETGTIIINGTVINDTSTAEYFTKEELTILVEKMSKDAGVDPGKVFVLVEKTLFSQKWKKSQYPEVEKIIVVAIAEVINGNNTNQYFTVDELCAMAKQMADDAKKDVNDVLSILKTDGKLFNTQWKYEQKMEVIAIIQDAVARAKDAIINNEYFTMDELCAIAKQMADDAKKDVNDVLSILKTDGKLFNTQWKYEQKMEVIAIIQDAVARAKDAIITNDYFTFDELNALVYKFASAANVEAEKVVVVLKNGKKFYETTWKKEQEPEVIALIDAAIKEISR